MGGGGGEIAFVGRENVKNIQKNKQNLLLFGGGGEIQNLGGEISPPKGPEKNTGSDSYQLHARYNHGAHY